MSRSVTVAVAYVMSVTDLCWEDALKVVRSGRNIANPNRGFQTQLQEFEMFRLEDERRRIKERFPSFAITASDREECYLALNNYEIMLSEKSICEGDCKRGDVCPTGVCRVEQKVALRRQSSRDPSLNSLSSIGSSGSGISNIGSKSTRSCPASPRSSKYTASTSSRHRQMHDYEVDELMELPSTIRNSDRIGSAGSRGSSGSSGIDNNSSSNSRVRSISRSPSTISNQSSISMNRYCAPRGLFSYTSSAPPSLRSSRIDLVQGSSGGVGGIIGGGSSRDLSRGSSASISSAGKTSVHHHHSSQHSQHQHHQHSRSSSFSTASPVRNNPNGKPPPSPKRNIKRYNAT